MPRRWGLGTTWGTPLLLVALALVAEGRGGALPRGPWAPLTLETLEDLYLPWDPTDGLQHDGGSLWVPHSGCSSSSGYRSHCSLRPHLQSSLHPITTPPQVVITPAEEVFHILQKTWKKAERLAVSVVFPKHPMLTFGQKS